MSQTVSIANKPEGNACLPAGRVRQPNSRSHQPEGSGAASNGRSHNGKPKIAGGVSWRKDGECNQIVILSKEDFALPLILNFSAARIFSLCNGRNSLEGIAQLLSDEFNREDYTKILGDVKKQVEYFLDKGIVEV